MSKVNSYNISLLSKAEEDLVKDMYDLKKSLFNLRFRKSSKDIADFSQFKKDRRNIARVKTEINRRKLGVSNA